MLERLQKILSARGICSRRKAEEYISDGLVLVNGEVAVIGQKADPEKDSIEVKGAVLSDRQEMQYVVMYKPRGVETTNSERSALSGQRSVRDLLPEELKGKVYPVGRLDKDSEGLLLFTNDGVLAYRLTHPSFTHEKEYAVRVAHAITPGQMEKLAKGITISGSKTKPSTVTHTGEKTFNICLTEGRNRQIRRMCQKVGLPVDELRRIRITTLSDDQLKPGDIRELTAEERSDLLESVELN